MALAELLAALESGAAAESAAVLAGARTEAERLRDAAEAGHARELAAEEARLRAELQADADAQVAAAARAWRQRLLLERHAALDRLYGELRARLPELLSGAAGERLAGALVDAALAAAGGRPGRLRCPPALAAQVHARVGGRPALRVDVDPAAGSGVQLEVDGGRLRVDATLEAILRRVWPRLRQEALGGERP
jgi:vacuolar-type H+-ATPase subunit E/Vma4